MRRWLAVLLLFAPAAVALELPPEARDDVLLRALADEMDRSVTRLRMAPFEGPYFVAFRVEDTTTAVAMAQFGARQHRSTSRSRGIRVDVRVGSPEMDQTNFLSAPAAWFPGTVQGDLPLDDDYDAIRREVWRLVDGAYKEALEIYSRKVSVLMTRKVEELLPDLAPEEPVVLLEEVPAVDFELNEWAERVRALSGVFRDFPGIHQSAAGYFASSGTTLYMTSDGFLHRGPLGYARLSVTAQTRAEDGKVLDDEVEFFGADPRVLPGLEEARTAVRRMAEGLEAMREAPIERSYLGPALFEGRAAADVWRILLGRHASSPRMPLFEDTRLEASVPGSRFLDRVGRRVAGSHIDVVDDPTRADWNGVPLVGHYRVDEEGVPAQAVTVVEHGKLRSFLLGRVPVKGFGRSNGHALSGGYGPPLGKPSALFVDSEEAVSAAELRAAFLEAVEDEGLEYGLVIRSLETNDPRSSSVASFLRSGRREAASELPAPVRIHRLWLDGREEPVRDVTFVGLDVRLLRSINAIGGEPELHQFYDTANPPYGMRGGGWAGLSVVTPALMVEEIELRRSTAEPERLPVLPHPYFEKRKGKGKGKGKGR